MLPGGADPAATQRLTARFPEPNSAGFYRYAQGLTVLTSEIEATWASWTPPRDFGYQQAVRAFLAAGGNFHRHLAKLFEPALERALALRWPRLTKREKVQRRNRDRHKSGLSGAWMPCRRYQSRRSGRRHALHGAALSSRPAPAQLADSFWNRRHFYLHNPETHTGYIGEPEFLARIRQSFEYLEQEAVAGRDPVLRCGRGRIPASRAVAGGTIALIACRRGAGSAGDSHHFRFIQLPFNLAMPEAFANRVTGKACSVRGAPGDHGGGQRQPVSGTAHAQFAR